MRGGAVGARALCTRLPSAAGPSPLHFPSIHKFNASPRSWLHFFLFLSQPIPCLSLQVHETTPSTKHGWIHQVCSFRYRGCGVADGWHLCPKVSYFPDSHVDGPSLTASRPLCAFASPFSLPALSPSQSISSQCQSTLASIITSSDASCLNAQSLLGLVATTNNASVVPTINTWLTGLCAKPACTNQTISNVVQNLTSGCSSDLSALGLGSIDANELTALVESAYPTIRKVFCLAE